MQTKTPPLKGGGVKFDLVSVSSTASAESRASASEALSPVAIARLAVESAIGSVVSLCGLKRQFQDIDSALGAFQSERRYIMHLPLGPVLVIHFWFA